MLKKRKRQEIQCYYFKWILYQRPNGIWYADGRSNSLDLGRHSLGTSDQAEARSLVSELDLNMAVKNGLVNKSILNRDSKSFLQISEGRRFYDDYTKRPASAGGPGEATRRRYKSVLDKFERFTVQSHINFWDHVTNETLDRYATWLDQIPIAFSTQCGELAVIKRVNKYLVENSYLPPEALIKKSIQRNHDSTTYCWKSVEVNAMIEACRTPNLIWLGNIILALAHTGMRISELTDLRWSDVDIDKKLITLTDESRQKFISVRRKRILKSRCSRVFPIHPTLLSVLKSIKNLADGYVFHDSRGVKVTPDLVRATLVRDVVKPLAHHFPSPEGEVGFKDGRLHSFRHYFCSVCANNHVPERMLMGWLGHKNSAMITRYYHMNDKTSLDVMNKFQIIGDTNFTSI
ncbi:site-specific integrase [uncultured Rubinisphaera sp.]|uniref:tyrosine-type recombinase/integrase n=1 Tax=uncultured Rubinisphaera sp. TaxID=1678686 RepID=UPI0030DB06C9